MVWATQYRAVHPWRNLEGKWYEKGLWEPESEVNYGSDLLSWEVLGEAGRWSTG